MNPCTNEQMLSDLKAAHGQLATLKAQIRTLNRENRLLCRRNTKLENALLATHQKSCLCALRASRSASA